MADTPPSRRHPGGASSTGRAPASSSLRRRLLKVAVAVAALAGLGFLFMRSVRGTRATPYTLDAADMRDWALVLEPQAGPGGSLLVLRPPVRLAGGLFHQIFTRAMESLNAPADPGIPLLLQSEFDRAFAGRVTPEALLAAARGAGLDAQAFKPECLGYRRRSDTNATEQLYFALFASPAFVRFREQIGALRGAGAPDPTEYDPASLSPVLLVAAAETMFSRWLPLRANPQTDCVAPIVISPA